MIGSLFQIALGVFFMCAAPHPKLRLTGAMPGSRRGPSAPISAIGRVCVFLIGLAAMVDGLLRLLGRGGLEIRL